MTVTKPPTKSDDPGRRQDRKPDLPRRPSHDQAWDHKENVRKDSVDNNKVTDWVKPPKRDSEKEGGGNGTTGSITTPALPSRNPADTIQRCRLIMIGATI